MKVIPTAIPEVLIFEPAVFNDERGFFLESYNKKALAAVAGIQVNFVQDNHSRSRKHVLRGLHYQLKQPQGKLVRVVAGEVFDVAVDLRRSSSSFGCWIGCHLSAENKRQFWIPEGFAHGFLVLSEYAELLYKITDYYVPEDEHCLRWNDPKLAIDWPLQEAPCLSAKDQKGKTLQEAAVFP